MKLCLGTVQLGLRYGVQDNGQPERDEAMRILRTACAGGVDTLDTAAAYGDAEALVGAFLQTGSANPVRVISKLPGTAFAGAADLRLAAREAVRGSLARLGVPTLDGYLFHDARYIYDERAVEALSALQAEGYAKAVGVSVYTPEEALQALTHKALTMIQVPYNILDRRLDRCGFFDRAAARGVQVYARSVLLQGLLTMWPARLPARMGFARSTLERYRALCAAWGVSPFTMAVRFVRSHPGIDYLVFGVDNTAQLTEYLSSGETLVPEACEEIGEAFSTVDPRILDPSRW